MYASVKASFKIWKWKCHISWFHSCKTSATATLKSEFFHFTNSMTEKIGQNIKGNQNLCHVKYNRNIDFERISSS